jgi:serine/threonine protein phosphatase PrpC
VAVTTPQSLYIQACLEAPYLHKLPGGTAVVFTRHAPNKETANEDAAAVIPLAGDTVVLAVADGLGGLPGGEVAASVAMQSLADSTVGAEPHNLREAILDGIDHANREILNLGIGAATTLAVVEIRKNILRTYHVGDAGVLVTGQRGRRRHQTVPHSPTGYAVEAGLINETEAINHDKRNLVSNVVGSHDLRIEISSLIQLSPRDTVVLASDGLFDNFLSEEIIERIRCGTLERAANTLLDESLARMDSFSTLTAGGHPDDLSFILYRMG